MSIDASRRFLVVSLTHHDAHERAGRAFEFRKSYASREEAVRVAEHLQEQSAARYGEESSLYGVAEITFLTERVRALELARQVEPCGGC